MKKARKVLRLLVLALLLILAVSGIGVTGYYNGNNRERYMDNEIKIEQVDKRAEVDDEEEAKT